MDQIILNNNVTKSGTLDPVNKRWKLALIGVILCALATIALFAVKEYSYLGVSIGGIVGIVTVYIGGDSYRQSSADIYSYPRAFENPEDDPRNYQ